MTSTAATRRLNCDADVLQIDPQTLREVLESIATIATAASVSHGAIDFVVALARATGRRRERPCADCVGRRVFVLEWIDPPFGAGHWVPDLVTAAGGEPDTRAAPANDRVATTWDATSVPRSPTSSWSRRAASDSTGRANRRAPCSTCFHVDAEVWAIDADAVMVRPGPRLVDGVEALASILHGVGDRPANSCREFARRRASMQFSREVRLCARPLGVRRTTWS